MTTNPIVNFVVSPELLRRIDTYHHKHHFPTRAAAIKFLIGYALRQNPKPTAEDLTAGEWRGKKGAKT
jgi:hypothetical protein